MREKLGIESLQTQFQEVPKQWLGCSFPLGSRFIFIYFAGGFGRTFLGDAMFLLCGFREQHFPLCVLCWGCSAAFGHTELTAMKFPEKSLAEFPGSPTGAGSAAGAAPFGRAIEPCADFKHVCASIPEGRDGDSKGWHSHCRTDHKWVFTRLRLCFMRGNSAGFCCAAWFCSQGQPDKSLDMAIRYQQYKPLMSLCTFALGNNWKSLPFLETAFLFLAVEQT